jgi:GxxExxY protein
LPLVYRDLRIEGGLRIEMIVADLIVGEIKSVERLLPVHEAQALAYPTLSGVLLGLLVSFNLPIIRDGIKRLICSR